MLDGTKGAHSYHHIRIKKNPENEETPSLYPMGKFHLNFEYSFINIFIGDEESPTYNCEDIWKYDRISLLTYGIIRILAIRSWLSHGIQSCQVWLSLLSYIQNPAVVGPAMDHLPTLNPFEWYYRYKRQGKDKKRIKGIFYAVGSVPLRLIYNKDLKEISYRIRDSHSVGELAVHSIGDYTRIFSDHRLYNQIISSAQFVKILKAYVEERQIEATSSIYQSAVGDVSKLVTSVQRYLSNSQRLIQNANSQVTGQFVRLGSFAAGIGGVLLSLWALQALLH